MSPEVADFLVEIGTEELPPKALRTLELAFAQAVTAGLARHALAHGAVASFATPRRLAVRVRGLATRQDEQEINRRGPPIAAAFDAQGQPTRAATAFAASCGVAVEALERVAEGKGSFLYFRGRKSGAQTSELLPAIVGAALEALPIPRRMRWGAGEAQFVRPVHWIVMLLGRDVVPARLLDIEAGRCTYGHRFHAPGALTLETPEEYERLLESSGRVLAGFEARRERIRTGVTELAMREGGEALLDPELLDEVTALVEWPVPLAGRFEARFLALPREVLISTLQAHQRYFPLAAAPRRAGDGETAGRELLPGFITVANIESRQPVRVREGNERVVRPRLADAAFFWEQDRREPLAARRERLDRVTFQSRLGSIGDKARRVQALATEIAAAAGADPATVARAAELCKCDLLTAMVGEFPELQGIMGTYYALADGEAQAAALAVREHYQPRGAGDELPASPAGIALALADRLDTLAGIFAIGEKPSGTKDPFGLRRAAIGVLRILLEKRVELELPAVLAQAVQRAVADSSRIAAAAATRPADGAGGGGTAAAAASRKSTRSEAPVDSGGVAVAVYEYLMERLRAHYLERGATGTVQATPPITTEMFDAVLETRPASPLDFDARLSALSAFLELPEAAALTAANKRIANILRKSAGGETIAARVDAASLRDEAEIRLCDAVTGLRDSVAGATARREYASALGLLAQLRPAVDAFFDQVMVMAEDPRLRANRLALLGELRSLFGGIADLSRLPG